VIALTPWLDHLRANLEVARLGRDPEGVHQLRVASRHLAVWLDLGGARILQADLRWLRAASSALRDLDVVTARFPDPAWSRWLAAERRKARARLLAALDDRRTGGLVEALALLPPIGRSAAADRLPAVARRALAAGEALLAQPREIERLHRLRRALRRLRYALEWTGQESNLWSDLQEVSGQAGDLSIALTLAESSPAAPRLAARRRAWRRELERARLRSVTLWRAHLRLVEAVA
jgi:CHAD domain-containing protein